MAGFGYWINVQDTASARFAVRMAGLPVLLIAASALLAALMLATTVATLDVPMAGRMQVILGLLVAVGIALGVMAFALRAGRSALVPLATVLGVAAFGVQVVVSPPWLLLVPGLALLLSLSGLRGWLWLRRHPG